MHRQVRWHVSSVGNHDGLHNYHWHGHVVEVSEGRMRRCFC